MHFSVREVDRKPWKIFTILNSNAAACDLTRYFWSIFNVHKKGQETWTMGKQRYTTEEIIHKLREADVLIGQSKASARVDLATR